MQVFRVLFAPPSLNLHYAPDWKTLTLIIKDKRVYIAKGMDKEMKNELEIKMSYGHRR